MFELQFKFKYLLVTDDSDRVFWMAMGNSLLFMPASGIVRGCGLGAMRPFEHYIPVRSDLSNVLEWIHWARDHDEEARRIVIRAAALARTMFGHEAQLLCLQKTIEAYAKLLKV
mmetsp:Transcript_94082/g.172475  ORF Transcript_94082/g.172475 Transcript_94082/m.172475 type:complete len:114 (+) Transcript_94082:1-342(+)